MTANTSYLPSIVLLGHVLVLLGSNDPDNNLGVHPGRCMRTRTERLTAESPGLSSPRANHLFPPSL
jgi:hypothetical protein